MNSKITLLAIICLCSTFGNSQKTKDLNQSRRYDEVSWLITHNAYQNPEIGATDGGAGGKNQQHSINTQLNNGVRSFMIDLQYGRVSNLFKGSFLHLGHGAGGYWHWMEMCDFLEDIKRFLDRNRNEIVTLHMQIDGDVTVSHIKDAFNGRGNRCNSRANIDHYLYSQPQRNKRWPSLTAMINTNKRLVVLSEKDFGSRAPSWLHAEFNYTRQNDYAANQVSELLQTHRYDIAGNPGRGDNRSSLLTINNFVTDKPLGYGDGNKAADANGYNKMNTKFIRSWFSFAKRPSMAVDFYERNNYSARSVITSGNNLNEIRGRFKLPNGADFTEYVITNSNLNGENPWYQEGAKTKARLHYSFPARPGETRVITFSHLNYTFSPSQIQLEDYRGSQKKTFIKDIIVTSKNRAKTKEQNQIDSQENDDIVVYRKHENRFIIDISKTPSDNINLNVYNLAGHLIKSYTQINSQKHKTLELDLPLKGIYLLRGTVNGKKYTKKIIN